MKSPDFSPFNIDKGQEYSKNYKNKYPNLLLYPLYYKKNIESLVNMIINFIEINIKFIKYIVKNQTKLKIYKIYNHCHEAYEQNIEILTNYEKYISSNMLIDDCDIVPYLLYTFYCLNFPYKGYMLAAELLANLSKKHYTKVKLIGDIPLKVDSLLNSIIFTCHYENSSNFGKIKSCYGNTDILGFERDDMLIDQNIDTLIPYNMIFSHRLSMNSMMKTDMNFIGEFSKSFVQNRNGFLVPAHMRLSLSSDILSNQVNFILLLRPILDNNVFYILMNNDNEVLNYSYNIVNSVPVCNKLKYGCKIETLSKGLYKKMRQITPSLKNKYNFYRNFHFEVIQEYYISKGVQIRNKYLSNLSFYEQFKKAVGNSDKKFDVNYQFSDTQKIRKTSSILNITQTKLESEDKKASNIKKGPRFDKSKRDLAANQKKIEKTKENSILNNSSSKKYVDLALEYYKDHKSNVNTMGYNFHTINHIEFTNGKKQKLLFKFEGVPKFNEQKYQVDLYERTFRYCDYSYRYLVIRSKYPKEESNQNFNKCEQIISKPVRILSISLYFLRSKNLYRLRRSKIKA